MTMIGIGLFVVDVQLSGFGIWSAGGVAGVAMGGWLMFSARSRRSAGCHHGR